MKNVGLFFCLFICVIYAVPIAGNQNVTHQTAVSYAAVENEAQATFHYFLDQVEQDATLTH